MLRKDASGLRALGLTPASLLRTAHASLPAPRSRRAPAGQGQSQRRRGAQDRHSKRCERSLSVRNVCACAPAPEFKQLGRCLVWSMRGGALAEAIPHRVVPAETRLEPHSNRGVRRNRDQALGLLRRKNWLAASRLNDTLNSPSARLGGSGRCFSDGFTFRTSTSASTSSGSERPRSGGPCTWIPLMRRLVPGIPANTDMVHSQV
jgi:hypothetical protein